GDDVVKVSRPGGNAMTALLAGGTTSAPIVVGKGESAEQYDEAGSGSWFPAQAVWTAETVPTGVTVQILNDAEVVLERTVGVSEESRGHTLDDVLPGPAAFTNPAANFIDQAGYK